jgi:hypothetical protein
MLFQQHNWSSIGTHITGSEYFDLVVTHVSFGSDSQHKIGFLSNVARPYCSLSSPLCQQRCYCKKLRKNTGMKNRQNNTKKQFEEMN